MKKIMILFFLIFTSSNLIFSQIDNPYFTSKQLEEIKPLAKTLSLFPNYSTHYSALQNSGSNKMRKTASIKMGGIKSTLIENWQNDNWVNYQLTTYLFDLENRSTGFIVQDWDNDNWINSINLGIVLNSQAFPIIDSIRFWDNNNWENKFKHYYEYNSNNDVTVLLTQMWNDTTKVWENMMNLIINYDDNFKITSDFTEVWSDTGWSPLFREYYYYNEVDSCKGRLSQMWMGNEYVDWERITYKYNDKNLKIEELDESWVFFQSKWMNSLRYKYEYNTNNQVIVKYDEQWDLSSGERNIYKKISTTYNEKLIAEELTQEWKESNWVNTDLDTYAYEDNQITVMLWQKWDDVNDNWYNFQRWTNEYGTAVSVENEKGIPAEFSLSQNYPNPFNPTTTIKYSIPAVDENSSSATNVIIKVYDILGKEITTLVNQTQNPGQYKVTFNAVNLPSGLYFYRLQVGNNILTKKCLLIK